MRDINKPVRKAFYELLDGNITLSSTVVPVSDEQTKYEDTSNNYVILASQRSRPDDTKTSNDREAIITIDIVTKTSNSVTKDTADDIADQIFQLLFPTIPHHHALPAQSGFQFIKVSNTNDQSLTLQITPTSFVIRRILEFSLRVVY